MSTLEGILAAVIVLLSFVGVATLVVLRRAAHRIDTDPRYEDPRSR
jgi:hypothetical protein